MDRVQRGFSLIETIIATSLLAIALVALAQFVTASTHTGAVARARAATTLIAEQKMEQLRALPWMTLASTADPVVDYLDASGRQQCPEAAMPCGEAVYSRRWSVARAAFTTGVLVIQVDVELVGQGHGRSTLVTARGRLTP
jgi:prepilin-type N-terminal cleavage/methylation domain-containing protein